MCLVKTVFAVFAWTTVTNYVFVSGEDEVTEPPEEKTEPPPVESHTFVALIDILFVDGNKRQCTGTIIHDNVVVTAAHCLLSSPDYADIELTGSFIVIGTKKMFDTGYENYLPIERIVTHPRYKGWTADIALVFTFAGMTTDKTGYALPLIGESVSTPVDSNVTILSWGRCVDGSEKPGTKWPGEKRRRCTSSEEENDSCESARTYKPLREGYRSSEQEHSSEAASSQQRPFQGDKSDASMGNSARVTTAHNSHRVLDIMKVKKLSQENSPDVPNQPHKPQERQKPREPASTNVTKGLDNQNISTGSHHVMTAEAKVKKKENLPKTLRRHRKRHFRRVSRNMPIVNVKDQNWPMDLMLVEGRSGRNASLDEKIALKSYYKNWRRHAKPYGPKENILTIETFGFMNVQTCKKFVDKVLPPLYGINTNEVVCYTADEHYISDDDAGAPAVRQGQLVAVTVGGVECDGDHVAIGMKMNCFCSWIAENLPENNVDWDCCKDCCRGDEPEKLRKQKKKYLYV